MKKKSVKRRKIPTMITFSKEARDKLKRESERTGKTGNLVLEDLLLGRDRFAPDVEEMINEECESRGLPRGVVIERALLEFFSSKK